MFQLVLFEPEIAGNTGSIARTCLATGAKLHLIRPLGFKLGDEALKRSGMDYWRELEVTIHVNFSAFNQQFIQAFHDGRVFSLSTKAHTKYTDIAFQADDILIFGPESRGLPEAIRSKTRQLRIPMTEKARSLNLAVSAAVVVYEAWRQLEFKAG